MDIKIRLQEEILFSSQNKIIVNRLNKLNSLGIITIEDFVNADIDSLIKTPYLAKQYKAFQKILKHKYWGEVLPQDILLDNSYNSYQLQQRVYPYEKLGFGQDYFQPITESIIKKHSGNIKMIDILREVALKANSEQTRVIAQFYVEYYDKEMIKQQDTEITSNSIEDLKNQIIQLLIQRKELDAKISQLIEQVNVLEGGSISNGRK